MTDRPSTDEPPNLGLGGLYFQVQEAQNGVNGMDGNQENQEMDICGPLLHGMADEGMWEDLLQFVNTTNTENPEANINQTVANLHQPNSSNDAQQMTPSSAETFTMDVSTYQQIQEYQYQPHTPRATQPINPANQVVAFPASATHSNQQAHFQHVMSPPSNPDVSPPAAFAPRNPDTSPPVAFAPVNPDTSPPAAFAPSVNSPYQQMPSAVPYQPHQMWPASVGLPDNIAPYQQQAVAVAYPEVPPAASAPFQQIVQIPQQQQTAVSIEDGHRMQFRVFYKEIAITMNGADISEGDRHEVYNPDGFGIYYGNFRPGLPNTVLPFPLPDVRPKPNPGKGFTPPRLKLRDKDIDIIMDICEDSMKGGLHVNYEDGIIYATRYSKTGVFFWANDKSNQSLETVKLERKIRTPVFNLHAFFARVEKLRCDSDAIKNPVVVFTFGNPWIPGSGSLRNMHVHAEVIPLAADKKLRSLNGGKKNKSIEKGSLQKGDIYKSKDPESI